MRADELPSVPTKAGSILTLPPPKSLPTRLETVAFSAPPSSAAGGGVGAGLDLLLLVELRFFLGAAEREQVEDVGFGERRLGAVGGLQVAGGAVQADGDVVGFDAGRGVEVDDGVDADGVGEVDVAALELVLGAGEGGAAVGDLDAAEDGGLGDGAADGEVDRAGELGVGVLEVELGRAGDVDVEPDLVGGGGGIGRRLHAAGGGERGEVDIGPDAEARDAACCR